jgi:hypothetical protein
MTARQEKQYQQLNRAQCSDMLPLRLLPHPDAYTPAKAATRLPSKAQARRWFSGNYQDFIECGEICSTQMVESFAASYPECAHWLDEETHWIWDLPVELEGKILRQNKL